MIDLSGKTAVVTGGSRGIGRAIVLRLATQGADVAFSYRGNAAAAEATAEEVRALGRIALPVNADVSQPDSAETLIKEALDGLARILQIRPDSHEAHFLRGRIYERRGEYDRAVEALKAATFWNPRLLQAYVILGRIYTLQKNCGDARAASVTDAERDPHANPRAGQRHSSAARCADARHDQC